MFRTLFALTLLAAANAACDNACSGHGTCQLDDVCECFDGWAQGITHMSGDCSDRVCPFDFAFVSNPTNKTKRHEYLECSARGICNRNSGECECFPGYEGEGCARTACPNDCSGHGKCTFIEDIPKYGMVSDRNYHDDYLTSLYLTEINYYGWDNLKERGCVCDPGYIDEDCSKRMCPYGDDPMTVRVNRLIPANDQTQTIQLPSWKTERSTNNGAQGGPFDNAGRTFSFIYMNKANETFNTGTVVFPSDAAGCHPFTIAIRDALYALPTKAINKVVVAANCEDLNPNAYNAAGLYPSYVTTINITFTGTNNEGPQHHVMANTRTCMRGGCSPWQDGLNLNAADAMSAANARYNTTEIESSDKESEECGNRGKCDYTSGECHCFQGYSGLACGTITALY